MPTTSCPLDCPDACSLDVTVTDGRVTKVRGDHRNPLTRGVICAKVARLPEHLYGAHRVLEPMIRTGPKGSGTFAPIGWDEALDLARDRINAAIAAHGAESVLPCSYGGSNGVLTEGSFDRRFFARLGATRLGRTLCAAPSGAVRTHMTGRFPGVALADVVHAELIVVWGNNPHATSIHFLDRLREARRRGARLIVVDPRAIPLCRDADQHLALRPGTDLPVALSLIRWFFETGRADHAALDRWTTGADALRARAAPWTFERAARVAGVDPSELERLALAFAGAHPAVLRCGWGVERSRCGGSAVAALLALPLVAGKQGVRGGGFVMSNSGAVPSHGDVVEPPTRRVNLARLGRALTELTPPVSVLWVYNNNPLQTVPDQERVRRGLSRDDLFTVVHDAIFTDTARYADLLLPATVFPEHDDLAPSYGAHLVSRLTPTAPAPGLARTNAEVFVAMEARLGLSRPGDTTTADEEARRLLTATPHLVEGLDRDGVAGPYAAPPIPYVDVLPATPDARTHLVPAALDAEAPAGLYGWIEDPATELAPLALISPARAETVSSTFGQLAGPAPLEVHPDDAAARGIRDGDAVRLWNELGAVEVFARVTEKVRPGVVSLAKGLWGHHTRNGSASNAVIPDALTDVGEGPAYFDARVEVARAAPPTP